MTVSPILWAVRLFARFFGTQHSLTHTHTSPYSRLSWAMMCTLLSKMYSYRVMCMSPLIRVSVKPAHSSAVIHACAPKLLLVITICPAISESTASFPYHHVLHMPATGYEFLAATQLSHEKSNHTAYFNIWLFPVGQPSLNWLYVNTARIWRPPTVVWWYRHITCPLHG
jgi:hypothetical protein